MAEQPRGELREYIAKPESDGTPPSVFDRLAKGISTMAGNMNPQVQTITYIDDESSTTTTGYEQEWPVDGNVYTGNPANDMLHDMAWNAVKGDDARIYYIRLMGWKAGTATGTFRAKRYLANWAPSSDGGGAGGENNTFSGTIQAKGAAVHGDAEFSIDTATGFETCTFTPDAEPEE